jgi:hypothetical protein
MESSGCPCRRTNLAKRESCSTTPCPAPQKTGSRPLTSGTAPGSSTTPCPRRKFSTYDASSPKTSPSLILLCADVQRRETHSIRRRSHRQRRNHVLRNDERRHIELLEHQDGVRTRDHRSHQQKSRDAAVRQRHQSELVILVIVSWYIFSRSLLTPERCKSCGR